MLTVSDVVAAVGDVDGGVCVSVVVVLLLWCFGFVVRADRDNFVGCVRLTVLCRVEMKCVVL